MNLFDIFRSTLTDMSIVSAITSTVFIILLGFVCRKKGIFSESVGKILSKVVLTVALPALAFRAFMQDINTELLMHGYIKMSGLKMEAKNIKAMFVNPIIIATFAGLFIWLFQGYLPQVSVTGAEGEISQVAFLRIDQTAPWLFQPMDYLAGLSSPLAWLAIGATLGEVSFKKAASEKTSWYYSLVKVVFVPALNIVILAVLTATNILPVNFEALATIVIMMAAAYAISFDREALLASNASLLSTIFAVVLTPVWIVVLQMIHGIGLFS